MKHLSNTRGIQNERRVCKRRLLQAWQLARADLDRLDIVVESAVAGSAIAAASGVIPAAVVVTASVAGAVAVAGAGAGVAFEYWRSLEWLSKVHYFRLLV